MLIRWNFKMLIRDFLLCRNRLKCILEHLIFYNLHPLPKCRRKYPSHNQPILGRRCWRAGSVHQFQLEGAGPGQPQSGGGCVCCNIIKDVCSFGDIGLYNIIHQVNFFNKFIVCVIYCSHLIIICILPIYSPLNWL